MSAAEPAPPVPAEDRSQPELLIISGMSGAGRSTTADVLEDLGWYVVDNLPPQMLAPLARLAARAAGAVRKVAVVVDVRGRTFFSDLRDSLDDVAEHGVRMRLLFLEASEQALVRRFESVRRPHPLQDQGRILDGIQRERELLGDLRGSADLLLDTTDLNVHQLSARIVELFAEDDRSRLRLTVMSFGFKYGLPVDADHVVDVRFLPNPHWVPELRPLRGTDAPVAEYVFAQPGAGEFVERYVSALEPVLAGYRRENRHYATIAIGCTGGKHRSVALAGEIGARLVAAGTAVNVVHRDLGRE